MEFSVLIEIKQLQVPVSALTGVRIKPFEFRENGRVFFPQGQSKLSAELKRVSIKRGLTVEF